MSATPDYDFWRAERARLLDNDFPTPDTGRCLDAVDTILTLEAELLALRARVAQLEEALEIIAGKRQCVDNLMGNVDVAHAALKDAPQ